MVGIILLFLLDIHQDGRGRFATLASAAIDRYSMSGSSLSSRGVLDTCKEGEVNRTSENGDSPRSAEINKKKLRLVISCNTFLTHKLKGLEKVISPEL